MAVSKRWILPGLLALAAAVAGPMSARTRAATDAIVTIEALPGTIVRWSVAEDLFFTGKAVFVDHGARIDPKLLLDDPARIPAIGP